jgi:hypothetical protein
VHETPLVFKPVKTFRKEYISKSLDVITLPVAQSSKATVGSSFKKLGAKNEEVLSIRFMAA